MINKIKKYWEISVIFILSLTPLTWFKDGQIIFGHDSGFRLNYLDHLRNLVYSWNPIGNFGYDWGILKGFLIVQAPETFFGWLFNSISTGEKISFIFWFFAMGISMYIFIKSFFPQRQFWIFRLFSSLFYMFNFFILQGWFIAERAKFSLYAALPLGLLIIYKLLNREYPLIKGTIIFSLIFFFLNGGGNPTLYGALLLVYFLAFLHLTFINYLKNGLGEIIYATRVALSLILGVLLINAYWIFTQIYLAINKYALSLSSFGGISGILAWENVVNESASFINLFRLQGIPDWYNNPLHPYSNFFLNNPVLIALSFLPILIILLGLFLYDKEASTRKQRNLLSLAFLIFIIGLVFAAGSHEPLGFLYIFLIEHLPGFAIFRSAFYKFGPTVWFSVIFLSGYFLNFLIYKYLKPSSLRRLVACFAIAFIFLYHFPFFTVNFFEFNKPFTTKVSIPAYIKNASNYINTETPEDTRILILPKLSPDFLIDSYKWGFLGLDILPRLAMDRSIIANDNISPRVVSSIYESIDQNDQQSLLRLAGIFSINKILWRNDVLYNDKKTTSREFSFEKENIRETPSISLEKTFGQWEIYNIKSEHYLPTFYSSNRLIFSSSSEEMYRDLLKKETDARSAILFASESNALQLTKFERIANKIYIQPVCVLCRDKELEGLKNKLNLPHANLLPGSIIYFLKSWRENSVLSKYENFPAQKIDVYISFSNTRISEVSAIIFKEGLKPSSKSTLIEENINKYKSVIKNALRETEKLYGKERNSYFIRLTIYLQFQRDFLNKLHYREGFSEPMYNDLTRFIDKNILDIEKDIWISTPTSKKHFFNIEDSGIYNIEFGEKEELPTEIILDGMNLEEIRDIMLEAKEHTLELIYPSKGDRLINVEEFSLENNQKRNFNLSLINPVDKYVLSFEYKISDGDNSLFEFYADKANVPSIRFNLSREIEWRGQSFEFNLETSALKDIVKFYLKNKSQESNVTLFRNFSVTKVFLPKVFITKTVKQNLSSQNLRVQKINPTEYVVHVNKAINPYLLIFSQSYDDGWKIYHKNGNKIGGNLLWTFFAKPLDEKNHVKVNGYANAWLIDEVGDYDLVVIFEQQKLFYLGSVISLLTLLFIIFWSRFQK